MLVAIFTFLLLVFSAFRPYGRRGLLRAPDGDEGWHTNQTAALGYGRTRALPVDNQVILSQLGWCAARL